MIFSISHYSGPAQGLHDGGKCMTMTGAGMATGHWSGSGSQQHNLQNKILKIAKHGYKILHQIFVLNFSFNRKIHFIQQEVHSCHLQQYCDHVTPLTGIFSEHLAHDRVA